MAILSIGALSVVFVSAPPAIAVPTVHEITANWADTPAPGDAPYGTTRTAEFHINTNDQTDPRSNTPVNNVRVTLTATNGAFVSIPGACLANDATPPSEITTGGSVLVCNLGTVNEGTATVLQAPVKSNGPVGSNLSVSGTVTSDTAVPAGPASTPQLPITGTHGMDLIISAPNQYYQGALAPSRFGDTRPTVIVDYGISMTAGSIAGPSAYSFDLNIAVSPASQLPGLQFEGCTPVDDSAQAAGIPYSDAAHSNGTNAPLCTASGSGASYTVNVSGLDYSLQNVPTTDSLGTAIPTTTNFIASGKLTFSYTAAITDNTGITFTATPTPFTFGDSVTQAETNTGNDVTTTTVPLPGAYAISWGGGPAAGRSPWDANLVVAPGSASNTVLPIPSAGSSTNPGPYNPTTQFPLVGSGDSVIWSTYTGAGGG